MAATQTATSGAELPPTPVRPRPVSRVLSGSPRTPMLGRSISGAFGSPGGYSREPEEVIVYELTSRYFCAGFSGESRPRCISRFGYGVNEGRRTGDYHNITASPSLPIDLEDGRRYHKVELYRSELRDVNLGLVHDRFERVVRTVHIDHLQLDQKPRRAVLVVSSLTPTRILDIALGVLFHHYAQPPTITLLNQSVVACVSAGLRNALVLDIGWEECTATVIGEYRIVSEKRSVRGGKMLTDNLAAILKEHIGKDMPNLAMVEEIRDRVIWCRSSRMEGESPSESQDSTIRLPVSETLNAGISVHELSKAVEITFFAHGLSHDLHTFDDQEQTLQLLALQALTSVSSDLRASCAARIVVTGKYSNIPGLKTRVLQEIQQAVNELGWPHINYGTKQKPSSHNVADHMIKSNPPTSAKHLADVNHRPFGNNHAKVYPPLKAADGTVTYVKDVKEKDNIKLAIRPDWRPLDATDFRLDMINWLKDKGVYAELSTAPVKEANASSTKDPATQKVDRDLQRKEVQPFDGKVRGVESLGAWAGASMVASLQIKGIYEVDREDFLKHGYRDSMTNMM